MDDAALGVATLNRELETVHADMAEVTLAASGDRRAFERLYQAQVSRVHSLCRRMIGEDVADDVTQDVFIRAWNKLHTFRGQSAFGTWLHRLAVNVILAQRVKLGKERERFVDSEESMDRLPSASAQQEVRLDFDDAVETLPRGARQVFVLHDVEGYKHDEIAGMLDITPGTSKSQLHRARMLLRKHVER